LARIGRHNFEFGRAALGAADNRLARCFHDCRRHSVVLTIRRAKLSPRRCHSGALDAIAHNRPTGRVEIVDREWQADAIDQPKVVLHHIDERLSARAEDAVFNDIAEMAVDV